MAIKPVTFQGVNNYKANLYALEIKSRFADQTNADGYYTAYGDEISATVESNTIRISKGALLVQGRLFEIDGDGETVTITIENGKVGYVCARIETYKPNRDNCSIIAKTAATLGEVSLTHENTYIAASDTSENKIYELPLYSFAMTDGAITSLTKVVNAVNEVGAIKALAEQAANNATTALSYVTNGFTFVVDSNAKLEAWANNAAGNDYTNVLIKKGTWEYTKGVDLGACGTIRVVGEGGNKVKITASETNPYGFKGGISRATDFCISDVNVELIDENDDYSCNAFDSCCNLCNCSAIVEGRLAMGFYNCCNLNNCSALASGGYANGYGFAECSNISSCSGSGTSSRANGYGFRGCIGMRYCSPNGTSKTAIADTSTCCACQREYDSTYAVANTANGGFNDVYRED